MIDWIPSDWLAAITSSTATAVVGFAVGTYYKTKVEKSVQHNFDKKLESVRAGFRKEEEALRADLKMKGEQIAALRSGALSGLANRYAALDKRRLEAIEKLWSSSVKNAKLKTVLKMTRVMNMEAALNAASKNDHDGERLRNFAAALCKDLGIDDLKASDYPHTERPFLPPLVWALYYSYNLVLFRPVAQMIAMRSGLSEEFLADPKPMLKLLKSALPERADFIDEFGTGGLADLIDELEEKLLQEIQRALLNPEADQTSLEQAATILNAADKLAEASSKPVDSPPKFND